jgi:hypothetical protein
MFEKLIRMSHGMIGRAAIRAQKLVHVGAINLNCPSRYDCPQPGPAFL